MATLWKALACTANAEKAEDGGEDSPASGQPPLPQTAKVDTLIEEKVTESLTK